ncbi:hypothetical protein N1851_003516 [Merluccius polli]|uniref:Uncharacterized protein n=1 Tax=Merluccius polli TaxID=89951 RepID=A0AA47N8K6_MERPO|nr:hypothetical protein N1851_003516 [Merluccius polli]
MASLCIHNFLRERRSEAYTPPAFADWENADHTQVDGAWRNQGHYSQWNAEESATLQPPWDQACNTCTVIERDHMTVEKSRELSRGWFLSICDEFPLSPGVDPSKAPPGRPLGAIPVQGPLVPLAAIIHLQHTSSMLLRTASIL